MTLNEWLRSNQMSDVAFARLSGIGLKQLVGRYRRGISCPSKANLKKIAEATDGKVTANDFLLERPAREVVG